jgi:hypothetical protein
MDRELARGTKMNKQKPKRKKEKDPEGFAMGHKKVRHN